MHQKSKLSQLFLVHQSHISLGTQEDAPSLGQLKAVENSLNVKLPPSYIWFLNNYGGGEIFGDEISSIYDDANIPSGDIRYKTKNLLVNEIITQSDIAVLETNYGEVFVLNTQVCDESGEYPVDLVIGKNRKEYAPNFLDLIIKYVEMCASE